ncbi:thiol reductant ABC exporter subunit CydD [Changpingibacter yushuensis]|uniref:thiol reductant ABC exporter subunit CydD n=1 Tax=Changpingibacter yushuensis TaxID=2758440 RepID=UPI00165DFB77|nr:thiol reductant ABC exporter subunit CydD [Changpingibacter yushuensis]
MKPLDRRLLTYAKDARNYIILLVATGLLSAVLVIAQSLLIAGTVAPVIDGDKTFAEVAHLIAFLAGVFALRLVITYVQEAFGHRAALKVIADLRTKVLRHAGDVGERWLSRGHTSSTVTLVTDALDDLEPYFVNFLPQLILTATVTPISLIVILSLDWLSAIAIIVCIPLIPIFMILIGRMTQSYSESRLASMQKLGQQLLDLLAGLTTLKALGREQGPRKRVKDLGDDYAEKTMQTLYVAFLSGAALEFLATLSTALVAVEVGLRLVAGHIGLYAGLAIIMLTPEVFRPLREVGSQFHASADGVAASSQVFDILDEEVPVVSGTTPAPDLTTSTIEISKLNVRAPGRATIAPCGLSGTIEPGKITALAGPSGSGKSTTASVLLKLLEPSSGAITAAGIPLDSIDQESWWKQVTWVPQRPVIVPGTLRENIGAELGPELTQASQLTGFADVVAALANGWDTFVGQGGVGLSVGQRQRLALTRALVEARPLVVLDEPSAHLDAVSEQYVSQTVQALRDQGHTVLVIAHRAAILDVADHVITVSADHTEVTK